jgi:hypothetical protein
MSRGQRNSPVRPEGPVSGLSSQSKSTTDRKTEVIGALLLQPDVTGVVIGELDDHHPFVFGQRGGNLLDELFLPLDVDGGKELVLVNRLQEFLVLVLALFLGIGERRHEADFSVEFELRGAAIGQLEQLV